MTLHQSEMLSEEDVSYQPSLDVDIMRMDERQLADYLAANALGWYFQAFPSISFLPHTAHLDRERTFGKVFGRLYAQAGDLKSAADYGSGAELPQPYESYFSSEFRARLSSILMGVLTDAVSGQDVLSRYGHTAEAPWKDRQQKPMREEYLEKRRQEIIQACLDILSAILWRDGEQAEGKQVHAALDAMLPVEGKGMSVAKVATNLKKEVSPVVHPDHLPMLLLVKQLLEFPGAREKYAVGNITQSYLDLIR